MRETGETREDRMSSAAETRSTNRESTSPAEYAAGADRELVSADVTTATAVAATVPGQPAQCDIEPAITGAVSHRAGSGVGVRAGEAGAAGTTGPAGIAGAAGS